MMDCSTIDYREAGNVAYVTLNRPDSLNAINRTMITEFGEIWTHIRYTAEIHATVLTGAGKRAFCSGVDRGGMNLDKEHRRADGRRRPPPGVVPGSPGYEGDIELVGPKTQTCWKPVITAVNGMACAGAFYLLGESDVIIASEHATFFDPHVTYGMVSAYESIYMAGRMPFGEAVRMQLMGSHERLSAKRALEIGLVSEVVESDALAATADRIASAIASQSPSAVQGTLRALWASRAMTQRAALDISPHFVAMADEQGWMEGQRSFTGGRRVEPTVR